MTAIDCAITPRAREVIQIDAYEAIAGQPRQATTLLRCAGVVIVCHTDWYRQQQWQQASSARHSNAETKGTRAGAGIKV
jgi:hypothetical protein